MQPVSGCEPMNEQSLIRSISEMPDELIANLTEAVELSDAAMIDQVVHEIGVINVQLEEVFSKLAENYSYNKMLNLLNSAQEALR